MLGEDGIGKVTVDGVEMSFDMGKPYDLENEFEDDESNLVSVRKTSVYDDRGTFLAAVETLEKRCRTEPYPMNVDLGKFRKLRANWLKNPVTATNYKKAKREFQSIQIDPTGDEGMDHFNWRGTCDEVNAYRIAKLYLVGVALREAQCSAGVAIVRNALEFARQNNQTENDIKTFALANNQNQLVMLKASVDASRRTVRLDETLRLMCQVAGSSSRFMGLPNPQ
ncbi:hypothetical protein [Ensifer sp. ENS11]|uniref:hypothetical protein n=1 Tax=Ensifer sp. ENS11 TaxID=2769291 RepID=UPI00177E4856|nr:hypothetical protein [Ensifer sp. ENS11]MBD9490515.1 hypothetical protein [Ensifer sp. ENS11]MDP9635085.1 hypothetical protein [Ensifer adhaerens]